MKSSPCYNCERRSVEPNCHMTCDEYNEYREFMDRKSEFHRLEHLENYGRKIVARHKKRSCKLSKYED